MEAIRAVVEKLTPEEQELLTGYLVRYALAEAFGSAFPEGMTIGKAIEEQRALAAKLKAEETAREKAETQRR
jgi:hypothetical protein